MIIELKYGNTNTYLIKGSSRYILFDTDWAGTFEKFCKALGEKNIKISEIEYLLISHFHPDHMGIAGQLAEHGVKIAAASLQRNYIHNSDAVFAKEKQRQFTPIDDTKLFMINVEDSRNFLQEIGIEGELLYTPGHSDDSISLWLDDGSLLVGDLNPLYELSMHKGTQIGDTWEKLLRRKPKCVYYGHAKTAVLEEEKMVVPVDASGNIFTRFVHRTFGNPAMSSDNSIGTQEEKYRLVSEIMKYVDKKYSQDKIQKKTGADKELIEDVIRMYLTHRNVSVQGILDRIEIKNR